jgi:hypothetical protein
LNAAHPHPPLSANLVLSFTMKSTSCRVPGTVVSGKYWFIFEVGALTGGNNLPAFVSPELREREPARHFQGVLVLLRKAMPPGTVRTTAANAIAVI